MKLKLNSFLGKLLRINDVVRFDIPIFGGHGLIVARPNIAKAVLTKPNEFYRAATFQCAMEGTLWKRHRKMLQPAFGPKGIRNSFDVTIEVCETLFNKSWKKMILEKNNIMNIHQHFSCLSADIIALFGFGFEFNLTKYVSESDTSKLESLYHIDNIVSAISKRFFPKFFWRICNAHPDQIKKSTDYLHQTIDLVIQQKRKELVENKDLDIPTTDFLSELIKEKIGDHPAENSFTDRELRDEVLAFFLAGHETTANTMTFAVLELLKNPSVLQKLREEIRTEFNTTTCLMEIKKLEFGSLANFKYLDSFLKEVLRLNPVVPILSKFFQKQKPLLKRKSSSNLLSKSDSFNTLNEEIITEDENLILDDVEFRVDDEVIIDVRSLHTLTSVWGEDAQEFKPERWDNGFVPTSCSYIPFGDGPTICIGQKLAIVEMKVVLIYLIKGFNFELIPNQNLDPICSITTGLKNGLFVKVSNILE
ncbi:hypothetical protein HDU92_000421 [Lobulomyces angularis]|nr:hypothetical protein HDU92_000421 [Lobulomyces angularis]